MSYEVRTIVRGKPLTASRYRTFNDAHKSGMSLRQGYKTYTGHSVALVNPHMAHIVSVAWEEEDSFCLVYSLGAQRWVQFDQLLRGALKRER
jgi:hypothetical protein